MGERSKNTTPEMSELLVSLYAQERLDGPIAEAHTFAAYEYNAVGDVWSAQKYARLGIETGLLYGGPHDHDVQDLRDLLANPMTHWSYRFRDAKEDDE